MDTPLPDPVIRDKADYHARSAADFDRHLSAGDWTERQRLALACRMLAMEGHGSGLAGQLTARGPRPGTVWTMRFGLGLDEIRASNLLLVDDDLRVLEGEGMPNPSNRFHLWIYRARPQVQAIVHTHPPHVSALSMIGVPLKPAHMDTSMFYEDCAWLPEWPGVPIGDDEGRIISEALGTSRSILLAHHGLLTATAGLEESVVLALYMERCARLQLMAQAAGTIQDLPPAVAREAHDYRLKPRTVGATFAWHARHAIRHGHGDALD